MFLSRFLCGFFLFAFLHPRRDALHAPDDAIPVLEAVVDEAEAGSGVWLEAIEEVASRLDLPLGHVFSTATFYSLFRTQPSGRFVIQVCDGLSCYLRDGADKVADYIGDKLGIRPGETSADGRVTLERVQCLASCGTAPALRVNDALYENLTPTSLDALLERLGEN